MTFSVPEGSADLEYANKGRLYVPNKDGATKAMFVEGGDEPQPGGQVQPWGPERIDERMLGLLSKHDTVLPSSPGRP